MEFKRLWFSGSLLEKPNALKKYKISAIIRKQRMDFSISFVWKYFSEFKIFAGMFKTNLRQPDNSASKITVYLLLLKLKVF
jgi:hypothetical protein